MAWEATVNERGALNACDNAIAEKERDGRVRKDDKSKLPSFSHPWPFSQD